MYCPFCGYKLPDDAKFCQQCGKQMPIYNVGAPAPSSVLDSTPATQVYDKTSVTNTINKSVSLTEESPVGTVDETNSEKPGWIERIVSFFVEYINFKIGMLGWAIIISVLIIGLDYIGVISVF